MLAAITVTGCAAQPRPVTDSTTQLRFIGFSLFPPQGNNWYFGPADEFGAIFGKMDRDKYPSGTKPTHTLLAAAFSAQLKPDVKIDTPENLYAFSEAFLRDKGQESARFDPQETELTAYRTQETDCVRYDQVVEERDNPKVPGAILTITAHGFICRNRYSPDWLIWAFYSERYIPGEKVDVGPSFEREGQIFLDSIVFAPPPKQVGPNRVPGERRIKCTPGVGCRYE